MAGKIRQPIDEKAFAKYIDDNVPQIKTPIHLKQVRHSPGPADHRTVAGIAPLGASDH